jgi:photosystem II stability/assembly factor-like uncharacterized protein
MPKFAKFFSFLFLLFSCSEPVALPPMKLPEPSQTMPVSTSAPATSRPTWELAFSEGRDLFALWGKNDSEIFAVGDKGTALHSLDAGNSWSQLELNNITNKTKIEKSKSFYAIWGLQNTIFIAGADGILLRSRDNGKSWLPMKDIPKHDLLGIWGSSEDDIYVVGKNSTLLHAVDGATFVPVPALSKETLYSVWGSSDKNVYLGGAHGLLLRSIDQGKSWQTLTTNSDTTLRSIWGRGPSEIYIVGDKRNSHGIPPQTEMLTSTDGATWKSQFFKGEGRAIFGDASNVYAVGPYVSLISSDKGVTWKPWIAANQHEALRELWGLWVSSSGQAFVGGQRGLILKLTATSKTISLLAGSLPVAFYDALLTKEGALLASGWQGNLLRWKDHSVEILSTGSDASLEGLAMLEDRLFAVGSSGALLASEDSGVTWKFLLNVSSHSIRTLFVKGGLYALATDGLFTSPSGEHWSMLWSNLKEDVHAISQAGKRWYLVGNEGFVASSTDAKTWKTQSSNTEKALFALCALTESEVFVAGAEGTVLYTNDGGETWQAQQSNVNQNLIDMLSLSAQEMIIVGNKGAFLHTKDAGKVWLVEPSPGSYDLYKITADERFIYVVGDGILARYPKTALQ